MRITAITLILCIAACTAFISCETGYDCSINNIAYNHIGFYKTDTDGKESKYKIQEALTVSLMVNGSDSIAINHIQDTDNLMLPMSYTNNRDTVIFRTESGIYDTLFVDHENIPYYISMECGTVMYHNLTGIEYTGNIIDSAVIVNKYIKFDNNGNIKLYLAH